jgi:hypothetical protein
MRNATCTTGCYDAGGVAMMSSMGDEAAVAGTKPFFVLRVLR